jgi:ATP-dependent DNA helicase
MSESQNTEYKSGWHDEYLDWICGFANAQGGKIYIGKDDSGKVIGLVNYKALMESIPNKIKNQLGIIAEVNLLEEEGKYYIEIVVPHYSVPISLRGRYFYRSGSVKQELVGNALNEFILSSMGKKWDSVLIPNVEVADLKLETFAFFKEKGVQSGRIAAERYNDSALQILENLNLIENGQLKRAAIMLFHPNPEKYVQGAYIKMGFFHNDSDLLFQDEIHGNLFEQIEKTMDLLLTKYTRALISYEGLTRIEKYEYPKDALREALLNAISHRDYFEPYPIQISVYADKIMIWNYGALPMNWTVNDMLNKHSSRPRNPDIATVFFRSGYVESWGRGMDKMKRLCLEAGILVPEFLCKGDDFWAIFRKDIYNEEFLKNKGLNDRQVKALVEFNKKGRITSSEYAQKYGISDRTARRDLSDLVEQGFLINEGDNKSARYIFLNDVR